MTPTTDRSRRWVAVRASATLLLAALATMLGAGAASAHANLASSDPADGAVLDHAPRQVTMTFTEPPDADLSMVLVLNAAAEQVQSGPAVTGSEPKSLTVPLPGDLPDGVYTVSWTVVSTADGHLTHDVFAFGVGVEPGVRPTPSVQVSTPSPSALAITGRTSLYAGLALAIGTAVAGLWTIGVALPGRRVLAIVAGTLVMVGSLVMVAAERDAVGASLGELLRSSTGEAYLWLTAAAAATLVGSLLAGFTSSRWGLWSMGLAAAAAGLVRAAGGHAAASSPSWPQELTQAAHIAAIGVWIGGFVPVLLLLRARARAGAEPPVAEVLRYSRVAGWAVLVVVATGAIRAVVEAGGFDGVGHLLFDTSYGTALRVKVGIALALIALGLLNRRRSIPRLATGDGMLARVMTVEIVGAAVVLGVTATLTGLPPSPPEARLPAAPQRASASGSDFATTVKVALVATPGTPGVNDFEAQVLDYDTGRPAVATAVSLGFEAVGRPQVQSAHLDLVQTGSGAWTGRGTPLSIAGVWSVTAVVQTRERATEVPLTLVTRGPGGQQVSVSHQSGLPDIVTITLAGGVQLQSYIDPGTAGPDEVHVTAFDERGDELPLQDVLVIATPEGGDPHPLDATRLSAGHFSAAADLDAGSVRIDIVATGKDGGVLQAWFGQTIGQA